MGGGDVMIINNERVVVWTLLHGCSAVSKDFGIVSYPDLEGDMICAVRNDPRFCVFRVPHERTLEYYNILVFVGLIPQGGVSDKVIRLEQRHPSGGYSSTVRGGVSANKPSFALNVSHSAPFDTSIYGFSSWSERRILGKQGIQIVHRSVLAFPKGDSRGTIIAFRRKSLEPRFWFVRSLPNELIVHSASSY